MRRLETEAAPEALEQVHALLASVWDDAPEVDEMTRIRLTTAVAELVANVVEHGRTVSDGPPVLVLTVDAAPGQVVAELEDDGVGYPPGGELPDDPMAESGRGLALVRAAVDEADYERHDGRNHWRLVVGRAA